MRQTRMIRIFFLSAAVLAVGAFWGGFYYGNNRTQPEHILTASGETERLLGSQNADEAADTPQGSAQPAAETREEPAVESMKGIQGKPYYLKRNDEYLAVYQSGTGQLYFETGLTAADLPEDLRQEAETGIYFSDLTELYSFLENYSS